MSHRQHGHLETVPPFTVPCEGHEARLIHRTHRESNPGPSQHENKMFKCDKPATYVKLKTNKNITYIQHIQIPHNNALLCIYSIKNKF